MKPNKKRNDRKKVIARRTTFGSLRISGKKIACISQSEVYIEEQWDTVYVSAKDLKESRNEILQNMKSLKNIFGDF